MQQGIEKVLSCKQEGIGSVCFFQRAEGKTAGQKGRNWQRFEVVVDVVVDKVNDLK